MNREAAIGGMALAVFLNMGGVVLAADPAPSNLIMGSGASLASGNTAYHGGTDTLIATGTPSEWTAGNVAHITNFLSINAAGGGTLAAGPRAPSTLMGNPSVGSLAPTDIAIGANLTLSVGGTLSGTAPTAPLTIGQGLAGNAGTITATPSAIAVGTNLSLTAGGTLNAATLQISPGLAGNAGTVTATPTAIAVGANLTLTAGGTLNATAPGVGSVTSVVAGNGLNGGTITAAGTLSTIGAVTLTGTAGTTLSVAPGSGTSDVLINLAASGGTQTAQCAPAFAHQRWVEAIKQGATASVYNLGTSYIFGAAPSSYTITATPGLIDRLAILSPDGTHCAVMAIDQGFSF